MTNRFHFTLKNVLALFGAALLAVITLFSLAFAAGETQWPSDTQVTNLGGNEVSPIVIQTSDSNYVIVWQDNRNGNSDMYAQKIDASDGSIMWAANGVPVTTTAGPQPYGGDVVVAPDSSGGVFVSWIGRANGTTGNGDIWVNHLNSADGSYTWNTGGDAGINVSIDNTASDDWQYILPDGSGGVYVIWRSVTVAFDTGIEMTHLNSSGALDAAWYPAGAGTYRNLIFPDKSAWDERPQIIMASDGSIYAGFLASGPVYVFNLDANGNVNAAFGSGIQVSDLSGSVSNDFVLIPDGGTGLITVYRHDTGNPTWIINAKATHIGIDGLHTWGTYSYSKGSLADLIGVTLGDSILSDGIGALNAISDGAGGAIATWTDAEYDRHGDVYAQLIDNTGTKQWGTKLVVETDGTLSPAHNYSLASDGAGGAVIAMITSTVNKIQRVLSDGSLDWGTGVELGAATSGNNNSVSVNGTGLPAMAAWDGNLDIYAQAVDTAVGGGSSTGGGGGSVTSCTVSPAKLDLPPRLDVTYEDSQPVVKLDWNSIQRNDSDAAQKAQVLFDYLDRNPAPELGATGKDLLGVFSKYMYQQIQQSENSPLVQAFEKELKKLTDAQEGTTKDVLSSLGITKRNDYFSEWWPYLLVDKLETNSKVSSTFMTSLSRNLQGDQINYKTLLKSLLNSASNITKSPQESQAALCISKEVAGYTLEDFVPGQGKNTYGKYDSSLKGLLDEIKQEGNITPYLRSLKNDTNFIQSSSDSLNVSLNALLLNWQNDNSVQNIIEFYQTDKTFDQFRAVLFKTEMAQDIEACLKDAYGMDLSEAVSRVRATLVQNTIESNDICDVNTAGVMLEAIKKLAENPKAQGDIEPMILDFINELLSLERYLSGTGYQSSFTSYFNSHYTLPPGRVSDDVTLEIYRDGRLIHSAQNPTYTSYNDESLPANASERVKRYRYHLVTRTQCDEQAGSVGSALINPQLEPGTAIDVDADIKIRVKEGYDVLFAQKLEALVQAAIKNNKGGSTTGQAGTFANTAQNVCEQAEKGLQSSNLTSDKVMNYILACHGNSTINPLIKEKRTKILPPLMLLLKLNTTEEEKVVIEKYIQPIIVEFGEQLNKEEEVFSLATGELAKIDSSKPIASFNESEKETIMCAGIPNCTQSTRDKVEEYFKNSAHAADLIVDVYDPSEAKAYQATGRSNIFGEIDQLYLGQFLSGEEYTIKVRLSGQRFVLPKLSVVTLNTAQPQAGGGFRADLDLYYNRQFRYGNFDESNDVIDLNDILQWGKLISEQPELYDYSNLDGLEGVDLLDAVTFQQNWGDVQESTIEGSQITLTELAALFGFSSDLTTKIQTPPWLELLEISCSI